jgi:hypothetical protein
MSLLPTMRPILTRTTQQASDCDMVLTHDDDLKKIDGLGHIDVSGPLNSSHIVPSYWQSPETLEPEVMTALLQRSNIEIHKVIWGELIDRIMTLILTGTSTPKDLSPTDNGPSTETSVIKVAMLSMTSQNWSR